MDINEGIFSVEGVAALLFVEAISADVEHRIQCAPQSSRGGEQRAKNSDKNCARHKGHTC